MTIKSHTIVIIEAKKIRRIEFDTVVMDRDITAGNATMASFNVFECASKPTVKPPITPTTTKRMGMIPK